MVNNLYNPITFETSLILYPPHCHCEERSDEAISLRLPRLPSGKPRNDSGAIVIAGMGIGLGV